MTASDDALRLAILDAALMGNKGSDGGYNECTLFAATNCVKCPLSIGGNCLLYVVFSTNSKGEYHYNASKICEDLFGIKTYEDLAKSKHFHTVGERDNGLPKVKKISGRLKRRCLKKQKSRKGSDKGSDKKKEFNRFAEIDMI